MFKIWAKLMVEHKIVKDVLYKNETNYDPNNFLTYMTDICYLFDIPTPVILKNHLFNFERFNIAKFKASDFVESVSFELMTIENVIE